jgi:hypothetical protein
LSATPDEFVANRGVADVAGTTSKQDTTPNV